MPGMELRQCRVSLPLPSKSLTAGAGMNHMWLHAKTTCFMCILFLSSRHISNPIFPVLKSMKRSPPGVNIVICVRTRSLISWLWSLPGAGTGGWLRQDQSDLGAVMVRKAETVCVLADLWWCGGRMFRTDQFPAQQSFISSCIPPTHRRRVNQLVKVLTGLLLRPDSE